MARDNKTVEMQTFNGQENRTPCKAGIVKSTNSKDFGRMSNEGESNLTPDSMKNVCQTNAQAYADIQRFIEQLNCDTKIAPRVSGVKIEHCSELKKLSKEVVPRYEVIYRKHLDQEQILDQSRIGKDDAKIRVDPHELNEILLRVHFPEKVDVSDIKLGVSASEIAVIVPRKYKLKIPMPSGAEMEKGQARFDQERKYFQLEICIPIKSQWEDRC